VAEFSTATKTATETILLTLLRQLKRFRHHIHADKVFGTHRPPQVAASFISNQACNVPDRHIASIRIRALDGRFRGEADIVQFWRRMDR
jgi:hypothetical protein